MLRDLIFKEIVREINSNSFSSFRLYGKITYGDLIKDTKQLEMTDDIVHQIFDFDLKVDIDFSFIDGEKPKKEIIAIDDDINQSLQNVTLICDKEHIRLDNFRTAIIEDDYVSKKIKEMTENHISSLTYNNNDIDFSELNMINDGFNIIHRDEEHREEEKKEEEIKTTPLEYLTSLEELNDTNDNDDINIYNEGKYPLMEYWDSSEITVDIVDKNNLIGFQEKFETNINSNEEMDLFVYHHQSKKKERDVIYTGTSLGKIRKYGLSEQTYIFNLENTKKIESPVLCIDMKQNIKSNKVILIAGFENGNIIVYEEDKEVDRNKDMFKDIPILSIKILKVTDKLNEFIVSDNKCGIFIIRRENSFFSWKFKQERIDISSLYQDKPSPIYCIDYYNIEDNEDISNQNEQNLIFVFISINQLNVLKIKPEVSNLLTLKISNEIVPDYAFAKANLTSKTLSNLLLISCNNIITLYDGRTIKQIGNYEHINPINKIGFVSYDFIYIIDHEKIKIVSMHDLYNKRDKNIKRVEIKEISLNEEQNATLNNTANINTSNQINDDIDEMFTVGYANKEIFKGVIPLKNYRNRIKKIKNKIYIFGKKKIKLYKIKHWNEVIKKMEENREWEKILCLGLDVLKYNKDNNLLFPIDDGFNEKKKEEFDSLLMKAYNDIKLGHIAFPKETAFKMCIEFCIRVNIIDELFGDFFNQFIKEKIGKIFFDSLEDFILLNEFKSCEHIPEHFFTELIKFYFSYSKKMYLSKLLLHFNISALSNKSITEIIINNDLINTYIYISMNNPEEDYYRPFELMLNYFNSKKDNVNYGTFITMHDIKLYNDDMLSSRQYFGHKLLWYSEMCLNGIKYPDKEKMETKAYDNIVRRTLLFLIANIDLFLNFDSFSFFTIIKRYYIEDNLYEKICRFSYKKYEDFIEILNLSFKEKKINQDVILDILCDKSINTVDNFYVLKDLYDFLSDACKARPELQVNHEIIINGIQYYVKYMTAKQGHTEDPFSCHHQNISNFVKENKKIEEKIIELLEYLQPTIHQEEIERLQSIYELSAFKAAKVFFLDLMGSYKESFELQLETLLMEKGTEDSHKNIKHFFKWINETLQKLHDKDELNNLRSVILDNLSKLSELSLGDVTTLVNTWFSDQIIDVITKLGSSPSLQLKYLMNFKSKFEKMEMEEDDNISCSDTDSTIYTKSTFERMSISIKRNNDDNESEISMTSSENSYLSRLSSISSLSSYNKQFDDYDGDRSTSISSSSKKDIFESNNIQFFDINPEDQKKEIQNQLDILQIKLLCENHRKDDIFSIVSNNMSICTNELLEFLIKNKVYDSVIYIYKVMGFYQKGIELTKSSIEKNYNKMLRNLSNENFKEKINKLLLNRHNLYLELGLSTCQLASENEDMIDSWVSLLAMLYKTKANIQGYVQQNTNNDKTYFYTKIRDTISESIEITLEKMCEYVTLPLIMEIVTEKIKDVIIGFKEFKKLLMRMLHSLSQMEVILNLVKKMLLKSVHSFFYKYKDMKLKGYCIKLIQCSYCNKKFENEGKCITISFKCGHSYHKKCCGKENNEYVCFICRKEEIEMSAMRINNKITVSEEVKATENKISVTQSDEEKIERTEKKIKEEKRQIMKKKLNMKNKKYLNFILLVDKASI